jgi:hypothetical protein
MARKIKEQDHLPGKVTQYPENLYISLNLYFSFLDLFSIITIIYHDDRH